MRGAVSFLGLVAGCTALSGLDGFQVVGSGGGGGVTSSTKAAGEPSATTTTGKGGGAGGMNSGGGSGGLGGEGGAGTGGTPNGGGGGWAAICDAIYGGVSDYFLCDSAEDFCAFSVANESLSCASICSLNGAECITAWDNSRECNQNDEVGCFHVGFSDILCECSTSCGDMPACNGMACVDSDCGSK